MLNQVASDKLWYLLEQRAFINRLYDFKTSEQGTLRIETFSIWRQTKNGRRNKYRDYSRVVRHGSGAVLYDQLESVSRKSVEAIETGEDILFSLYVPLSPDRANKLLGEALELQAEVDKHIEEART